jgi:drug/metabolite transporter (DMT)-like permease
VVTKITGRAAPGSTDGMTRFLVLLAFAAIYIIWGSTYLAIRYAVETIPPLITAGGRHLIAGSVLFAWAWMRGYRPTRRELISSTVLGALFFLISHGSLHWAEQTVASGLAALLVATEPMWIAMLSLVWSDGRRTTMTTVFGLLLGFVGVALLTTDQGISGTSSSLLGALAIIVGTLSWSLGMIYSKRASLPSDAIARAGLPSLAGSVMLLIAALVSGEFASFDATAVTTKSLLGVGYLIVFGSIVAFTAYTWLLERCSATLIATHTYVNPIVAVLLGWMLAGEAVSSRIVLAGAFVVVSVFCVSLSGEEKRQQVRGPATEAEEAA